MTITRFAVAGLVALSLFGAACSKDDPLAESRRSLEQQNERIHEQKVACFEGGGEWVREPTGLYGCSQDAAATGGQLPIPPSTPAPPAPVESGEFCGKYVCADADKYFTAVQFDRFCTTLAAVAGAGASFQETQQAFVSGAAGVPGTIGALGRDAAKGLFVELASRCAAQGYLS